MDLFFPRCCPCCNNKLLKHETDICVWCLHALPLACHHRNNDPEMSDRFYGRVRVTQATALLQFQKAGATQKLLHCIKYKGRQQLGAWLGAWLGEELCQTAYLQTDMVIPVPLHYRKLRKRGYNQVDRFARQLAKSLDASFADHLLIRSMDTHSSVFKGRHKRASALNPFGLTQPKDLHNKAILLVDDITTTGMTLEHCASLIWAGKPRAVRFATMFIA